jgi:hypothetical protein
MAEPKVLISKKSIKTMGKDMVRIKRGDLDVEKEEGVERNALTEEIEKRRKEEERLVSLQKQADKIVDNAREKKEPSVEFLAKQEEAKKLAALQESRKKAEAAVAAKKKEQEALRSKQEAPKQEAPKQEVPKQKPVESKEQIEQEKEKIEKELSGLIKNKKPLEERKESVLEEIRATEAGFQDNKTKEDELWQKLSVVEKEEAEAKTPQERREIEKKRWKLEKKREEIEKQRWPEDEKLEQLEARLKSIERESRDLAVKEKELLSRKKEIEEKEERINLNAEMASLKEALKEVDESKSLLEEKVNILFKNNEDAKDNLNIVLAEEKRVESEKAEIENKERTAENITQKREFEKTRWKAEERRRQVESKRWKLEEEKEKVYQDLKDSQDRLKTVLNKKESISQRIEEINMILGGKDLEPNPKSEPEPKKYSGQNPEQKPERKPDIKIQKTKSREQILEEVEKERVARIEEARKRIDTLKKAALERKQRQEQMKNRVLPKARQKLEPGHERPVASQEERRADIMKRLRVPVSKKISKEEPKALDSEEIIRVVPKKPSFREKLWVRALVVAATLVILAGISTFWYWYFRIRTSGPVYPPGYEKEKEGINIPQALFNIQDTVIMTVSDAKDLSDSLKKTLQTSQAAGQFKRIIIKKEGEIVGVKDFFTMLGVTFPDDFYSNTIDEPTMFIYSQGQGNRLGFVVKVSTSASALNVILKAEEPTAETDLDPLFFLMGKEGKAVAPYFKNASDAEDYTGPDFRFKTINQNDLGIFYSVNDYYFAFSSSSESMEKLLANIQNFLKDKVLLSDLKSGDQGDQVYLLQNWLAREFSISDPGFTSGQFNQTTKDYIVKFQEKYATDILIPQGQTRGTGILDVATRKKLNQIYSNF